MEFSIFALSKQTDVATSDSKELIAFKKHFESHTGIKVEATAEDHHHWKRLLFQSLDAEQLLKISEYILLNFSTPGRFSHLLIKLHGYRGAMALTADINEVNKFIIQRK